MANSALVTTTPAPVQDVAGDGRWMSMHHRFLQDTLTKQADILFVGDSLIQQLQNFEIWQQFLVLGALNFGIGGDATQHLLWRLSNGELENIHPKVVVVMIGTNNFLHSGEDTFHGIQAVIDVILKHQPEAQLIVLELFPRGERPNPQRQRIELVNRMLNETYKNHASIRVLNIDPGFVNKDGIISYVDMPDYLHLSSLAYNKAFGHLYDILVSTLTSVQIKQMHDQITDKHSEA